MMHGEIGADACELLRRGVWPVINVCAWLVMARGIVRRRRMALAAACVVSSLSALAAGQCTPAWTDAPVNSGLSGGEVYALTTWDPDGPGPSQALLVAGGSFTQAGGVGVQRIAAWDGSAWHALGAGVNDDVRTLRVLADGRLMAGGWFTQSGGTSVRGVAMWQPGEGHGLSSGMWSEFGGGVNGGVFAITELASGDVVVAGTFSVVGVGAGTAVSAASVARYDGAGWHAYGEGLEGTVFALAQVPGAGDQMELVAGGSFSSSGARSVMKIARFTGSGWEALGGGMDATVLALGVRSTGELIAGGIFGTAGTVTARHVARWNGSHWQSLGSGMSNRVWALTVLPDDTVIAGGWFITAGGIPAARIARWSSDNSAWSNLGSGINTNGGVYALTWMTPPTPGAAASIIAGGNIVTAGGLAQGNWARFGCPLAPGLVCNDIDFNNDTSLFDPQDVEAFLSVYGEGPCVPLSAGCDSIDFNNDGSIFDPCDLLAFLVAFGEGPCTACGQ